MTNAPRDNYPFDCHQARPNCFATKLQKGGWLVVLDPKVAAAFEGSETVRVVLKSMLKTMPEKLKGPAKAA